MKTKPVGRRAFLKNVAGAAAAMSVAGARTDTAAQGQAPAVAMKAPPKIKFAVIGINHSHVNSQTDAVIRGGGELVSV